MALSVRSASIESDIHRPQPTSIEPLVLAVDDEPEGRDLVTALLNQADYNVVTAASGEEALAMAARRPPDLVVLDVVLPGIDGFRDLSSPEATARGVVAGAHAVWAGPKRRDPGAGRRR